MWWRCIWWSGGEEWHSITNLYAMVHMLLLVGDIKWPLQSPPWAVGGTSARRCNTAVESARRGRAVCISEEVVAIWGLHLALLYHLRLLWYSFFSTQPMRGGEDAINLKMSGDWGRRKAWGKILGETIGYHIRVNSSGTAALAGRPSSTSESSNHISIRFIQRILSIHHPAQHNNSSNKSYEPSGSHISFDFVLFWFKCVFS